MSHDFMEDLLKRQKILFERIEQYNKTRKTSLEYHEILKLHKMLEEAQIPHTLRHHLDGYQILYPSLVQAPNAICSVIEHYGSYGMDEDLLEIMGLLTTDEEEAEHVVIGYLTAENVFARIEAHWKKM